MIFDAIGLPKDTGASDYMDSARLAGIMAVFNVPNTPLLHKYLRLDNTGALVAVRHPNEFPSNNPKNFTRDQLMCLTAGMKAQNTPAGVFESLHDAAVKRGYRAQNTEADIPGSVKKFPNGADILFPSNMNHLRIAAGLPSTFLGRLWLKFDIIVNGLFTPMEEQNQLICMVAVAGKDYVKMYKKWNPKYREATRAYWCGWRQEPELAEEMIRQLENY